MQFSDLFTELLAQARYEHEVASLDLSEAAQAVAQAASLAERGNIDEIQHLAALADRLYKSADRHRALARRLESQTRRIEDEDN